VSRILILYFSVYGHTRRICETMRSELVPLGHAVDVVPLAEAPPLEGYDAVVIGASIRNGKHNPAVFEYVRRNLAALEAVPSAFFSVSLVARKPAKNTPETNPYMKAFVARTPWKPKLLGVFGGDLDYQRYRTSDRYIIRFIMTLTRGPTDPNTKAEYTDWAKVSEFARNVAALAAPRPA